MKAAYMLRSIDVFSALLYQIKTIGDLK